jgi:iron complex outermembrane receptor protein
VAFGALMGLIGGEALAQPAALTAAEALSAEAPRDEVVVVTGSRSRARTVADSAVPVDVISAGAIEEVSFTDTQDVLKTLVPSFNTFRQPISDGATFIRPATLRGLPPDKTLVLVNSKRRHRASLVSTAGSGQQGPDVATIPASALKTVEVLRDGAGAQYGSDAIAGVLNFILKDAREGGEIQLQAGIYGEGDGEDLLVSANIGLPLGEKGFINVSVEGTTAQGTNRGDQFISGRQSPQFELATGAGTAFDVATYIATYPETAARFGNGKRFDMGNVQLWGQPEAEAFRAFINAGHAISDTLKLYAWANYSNSNGSGDFNYRFPDPEFGRTPNPNGRQPSLGPIIRLQNGQTFQGTTLFPAGYTPRFSGQVTDHSFTGGVKGTINEALGYDLSARYGGNTIVYTLSDTWNPSLGPSSPTSFKPGSLKADEYAFNLDFTYERAFGAFASPLALAFGAEYRNEGYEIIQGDEASWTIGPYARRDPWGFCNLNEPAATRTPTAAGLAIIAAGANLNCRADNSTDQREPAYQLLGVGSDGFPGYGPGVAGELRRDSVAFYVEASADVTERLFVSVAARYENFSDFGETSDGKIAARFEITDDLALRGSVGTGFRAPTVGQQFTTVVSTTFVNAQPVNTGLFPASNPVSLFLGAKPLKAEESTNYSIGVTANLFDVSLTLDFYRIELVDQFWSTRQIPIANGSALQAQLIAANVPGANTIGGVRFFQNAFDSVTSGIDVVATRVIDWGDAGRTSVTVAANYNAFEVGAIRAGSPTNLLFQETDVFDLENNVPKVRGNVTLNHGVGSFGVLLRANFWGAYTHSACLPTPAASVFTCPSTTLRPEGLVKQKFAPETLFDLEASYDFANELSLALGIRNLLDSYPNEGNPRLGETTNGRIYRSDSPVDWQGRFFYVRTKKTF